jgi:AAA family ATP:ADP antiporter
VTSPFRALFLIRPGEIPRLLLSCGYFFFLLASYYVIRPMREQMSVAGGVSNLPLLMTATLAAMLLVNPIYGWVVSRMPRRRFVPLVYGFFGLNLLLFWVLFMSVTQGPAQIWLGRAFYVWTSVFNLFVVSVFWSTMVDAWSGEQAKRLFAVIGIGGTVGAIGGAAATNFMVGLLKDRFGEEAIAHVVLLSVLLLACAVGCFAALVRTGSLGRSGSGEPGPDPLAGLKRAVSSPYLLSIVAYMLLFTITGTLLYMEQQRIVEATLISREDQTRFFARLDMATNATTLLLQAFVTGRLIMLLGLGAALLAVPLLTLAGFGWLAAAGSLSAVATFQVVRRAAHYAVDRPAREALFSVLGADDRYKAKSLIDTFVYRGGDAIGAWAPKLVSQVSAHPAAPAIFACALTVTWVGTAVALAWQNGRAAARLGAPGAGPGVPGGDAR